MFARVIYYGIWYFAITSRPPCFGAYSQEDGKSPVGGRTVAPGTRGQRGDSKKEAGDLHGLPLSQLQRTLACNCVVATVTSLVTSAMQYSEVRVVCVASEH